MLRYLVVLVLLCHVTLLAPNRTLAWNSVGHLAVAKLAYDELSDGQRVKLFTLLKAHPHWEMFLAAGRPPEIDEAEWAVLRAAVWPDWVRPRTKDTRGPEVTRFHRGEDHYINVPFIDPTDANAFAGKTLVHADTMNILCALKQRCNEMQTKTAAAADKAIALCWIFHLVGDIHQPLHNVAYFSRDKAFLYGDQGGNKFGVRVNERKWNLHAFWDDILGEDPVYTDDSAARQAKIYRQAVEVAANLRGLQLAEAEKEKLAKNLTFASWSEESALLARTVGYPRSDGGILKGVQVNYKEPIPDSAPEAGPDFAKLARATAEVRILLAGRRLAQRVDALLSK